MTPSRPVATILRKTETMTRTRPSTLIAIFGTLIAVPMAYGGDRDLFPRIGHVVEMSDVAQPGVVASAYANAPAEAISIFEPGLKTVGEVRVPDSDQRISSWLFHHRLEIKRHLHGPAGRTPVPSPSASLLAVIGLGTLFVYVRRKSRLGAPVPPEREHEHLEPTVIGGWSRIKPV